MTGSALLITVYLPERRYHGVPEWPPSPFRLFQALVAGALAGSPISRANELCDTFGWFENLDPPTIVASPARQSMHTTLYVPNNDRDSIETRKFARILDYKKALSKLKTTKHVKARLIESDARVTYVWCVQTSDRNHAESIVELTEQLYQLGRGVDMAFAVAEILDVTEAETRLAACGGALHRPAKKAGNGEALRCPVRGSYKSLLDRRRAQRSRTHESDLKQAPPPRFRVTIYASPPNRPLFDLVRGDGEPNFQAVPQTAAARLVEGVRDRMAALFSRSDYSACTERIVIGRGATEADKAARIRIVPLPSIGSPYADRAIRRVLIEVPPDCPIPAREIERAAGAVHLGADEQGVIEDESRPQLVRATDEDMLRHYGIGDDDEAYRRWRTMTPAALPERAARRRIDPARIREEAKGAAERLAEEARARAAVRQALRHAGIETSVEAILVQREPFHAKGARAEAFAPGTRFSRHRLWHVEVAFVAPREGPVVIGDGRYLGLGLMAPVKEGFRDVMVFDVPPEAGIGVDDRPILLRAVRRALMARSRDGRDRVPRLFGGHEDDGGPARSGRHEHVFLAADDTDGDECIDRLVVAAPWVCDRSTRRRRKDRAEFDRVVSMLETVRAGQLGVVVLGRPTTPPSGDRLFGPARVWESRTRYRPTRHNGRRKDPAAAVSRDLVEECIRRGLPRPEVEVLEVSAGPNGGRMTARVRLCFAVAVKGPILLGRDSHSGGGLFHAADEDRTP